MRRLFWLAKTRSGSADIRFDCKYLKKRTKINSLIILDLFIITADQILSFSPLSVMFFDGYREILWKNLLCKYLALSSLLFSLFFRCCCCLSNRIKVLHDSHDHSNNISLYLTHFVNTVFLAVEPSPLWGNTLFGKISECIYPNGNAGWWTNFIPDHERHFIV